MMIVNNLICIADKNIGQIQKNDLLMICNNINVKKGDLVLALDIETSKTYIIKLKDKETDKKYKVIGKVVFIKDNKEEVKIIKNAS